VAVAQVIWGEYSVPQIAGEQESIYNGNCIRAR
jgi:hypothetical protein